MTKQSRGPRAGMPRHRTVVLVCTVVVVGVAAAAHFLPFSVTDGSTTFTFGNPATASDEIDFNAAVAGQIADQVDLGELTPMCDDLPDLRLGVTFTCTATTVDGRVIELAGGVESKGAYIEATNLVFASTIERRFVESYSDKYPADGLTLESVDCGDGTVFLVDDQLWCTIDGWRWVPATATVTIHSIDPLSFAWTIDDVT